MKRNILGIHKFGMGVILLICLSTISSAQTIAIQNGLGERGYGWMFTHNGLCYAVLPRHVAGPFPRITITSEAPIVTGTGTVDLPFWDGIDLAVAVVRGGIQDRCVATLDALDAEQLSRTTASPDLVRLTPNGEVLVNRLRITQTSYLTFEAELQDHTNSIGQGTSGAFAMINGRPVGMAISAPSDNSALFIRADEIYIHLERYLGEYTSVLAPTGGAGLDASDGDQGIALVLTGVDLPPINPTLAPENMLSDGQYVFELTSSNRIVFAVDGEDAVGFSRAIVQSDPNGGYALPREILIEFSPTDTGNRFFGSQRFLMGQDGYMDTSMMGQRSIRRLRITIMSAWSEGPVAISGVILQ